jgi:tRNA (cytidine/uridine-2'-O-)-methyltransferase
MFDVVLVHPEIPPNTGNVIRLCANAGARLHLVEPLGFSIDDKQLKRAGLDYHEFADMRVHVSWEACVAALGQRRMFAFSRRASRRYDEVAFAAGDVFVLVARRADCRRRFLNRFPSKTVSGCRCSRGTGR